MAELGFVKRCVAIDLEVARENNRILRFAAIGGADPETPLLHSGGNLSAALVRLDELAAKAELVLGHNIIAFDLPHLRAANPGLRVSRLPAIDTLRLSPLAFPRNPYHKLVKHYQDGGLIGFRQNKPELDTRLSIELFGDEYRALAALRETNPQLLTAWHWLISQANDGAGMAMLFHELRDAPCPSTPEGRCAISDFLRGNACVTHASEILEAAAENTWPLIYALAWISVAGSNSVMPPWVRHQFPEAASSVRRLRGVWCDVAACEWCAEHHNAQRVLKRWFQFSEFRAEPIADDGRPMQQAIVEATIRGEHVLGILPTGTGKSVCYQIPALSRYENTGAITIVISPLVALMADQVKGLESRGITSCAALNSLLSMPERMDTLERVRLGDIAILFISPEQLRNKGFRKAVAQREIAGWVLDEAHCLSKWGHDFRPDYRYVGRFIKETVGNGPLPTVLCLTATAKPDVIGEIGTYFRHTLGVDMTMFNGGVTRTNLLFKVCETTPPHKLNDIHHFLEQTLAGVEGGGAIVYCATRAETEETARVLAQKGWPAAHFHAGLQPETKKTTQGQFIDGTLRVIVATNAFGMGIDKPDVRLVIHADIPGSLESYIQEAGRAGRDQLPATCILLYCADDVEKQFGLSAFSRLSCKEIQSILRALRQLAGKRRSDDELAEVVATPGEILDHDDDSSLGRDSAADDTRVRTAIAWLEESRLVSREENRYEVFPSSLRVPTIEQADAKLASVEMPYRGQLRAIVDLLLHTDPTEGVTTDELMGVSRLSSSGVRRALRDLERFGIASDDMAITAQVHVGIESSSKMRLKLAVDLEIALINLMHELAPDLENGASVPLYLRRVAQRLKNEGHIDAFPERLNRILRSIEFDGRGDDQKIGSIRLRKADAECICVTLQCDWEVLAQTAELRRNASARLLDHFLERLEPSAHGADLVAATTLGKLYQAIDDDLVLKPQVDDTPRLVERGLLWLHEQEVLRLGKGLVVLRPAMTIRVAPGNAKFNRGDYNELEEHYKEQVVQLHVMAEYARRGIAAIGEALELVTDYFQRARSDFLSSWFPQEAKTFDRQTTAESWRRIVDSLNPIQRRIVTDDREQTNVLILAGPGSGKTRVLVHRIAYLVRARRERPQGILALAYNRHAASEIRRRLRDLIGDDAIGVTVLTCHALAMRLTGASFVDREPENKEFENVLSDAVALIKGNGLGPEEADVQRERLLAGFRWILVDEYQDIGQRQYDLISALAGRTLNDPERQLSLFAVGDDDQNIYGFAGASVAYIRRFEMDYKAKIEFLVENYRSTAHIISAANNLISLAAHRMKTENEIVIDRIRKRAPAGGAFESLDVVTRGRVQILSAGKSILTQAEIVMRELQRLSSLNGDWDWSKAAVIARQWKELEPIRAYCELNAVPVQCASDDALPFWGLRETQTLVSKLAQKQLDVIELSKIADWISQQPTGPWWESLQEAVSTYRLEYGDNALSGGHLREWLAEWDLEVRRRQRGLLLLTAHRAKGLEFDHVAVLDGGWNEKGQRDELDAERRLYYVAMTRTRHTLTIARLDGRNSILEPLSRSAFIINRKAPAPSQHTTGLERHYRTLTPKEVDLGYAGRQSPRDPMHARIAELQPGNRLQIDVAAEHGRRLLRNQAGQIVGRLANGFAIDKHLRCVEARVYAVLSRRRETEDPNYASGICCNQWEVVIPELVFVPNTD